MSLIMIAGCIVWGVALFFGYWKINGIPIKHPLLRIILMILLLSFVGVFMILVGALGLIFISPLTYLLGYGFLVKLVPLN